MTICEYTRGKYFEYRKAQQTKNLTGWGYDLQKEPGTWGYFKDFIDYICGGIWLYHAEAAGITKEKLNVACEKGYLRHKEYTSWRARNTGKTHLYEITNKGAKAIWNAYEDW